MCFRAAKMISTLTPPLPPQKYKLGSEAGKRMTHFSLTEKRKRRKEGGKEEKKRGGKEEAKKECKCVFRLKKMISILPPRKYKFGSEAGKEMTPFSLTEKRKRRKEGGKEGKKRGGKEKRKRGRKKEEKKERRQKKECKCVFRLKE